MSPLLKNWESTGEYIEFGPFRHQLFVKAIGNAQAVVDKTLLLIHGFPESSYSFHSIIDGMLERFDRIILLDMIGYGLSDKPIQQYDYSLISQADAVMAAWKHFGISGGHVISHDMGTSVATEILARHENQLMPSWFSEGLKSMTFTNGSMVLKYSNLRVTQKILLSKYGHLLKNILTFKLFNHQIRSAHGNQRLSAEAVEKLWELTTLQNGHQKAYLTIRYLNDRKKFEKTRWLPALAATNLPVHFCWGDQDQVAKIVMAHHLKEHVQPKAKLTIMEGLGHFCQLENPNKWVDAISSFYK